MKTTKLALAVFVALVLFAAVSIHAQSHGLVYGGSDDRGVGPDGNHYFELYYYSNDSNQDCSPYSGSDGFITVWFNGAAQLSGGGWVPAYDVFQSYAGVSGFSHHYCQVNVYARNGVGTREISVGWTYNGNTQPGGPIITQTF